MLKNSFIMLLLLVCSVVRAESNAVVEENLYYEYQKNIETPNSFKNTGLVPFEQALFVTALTDLIEEGSPAALKALSEINTYHYDLAERLRLGLLKIIYLNATSLSEDLQNELASALIAPEVNIKIVYLLASYEKELLDLGLNTLITLAQAHPQYKDLTEPLPLTGEVVTDLFYLNPDLANFKNGEYSKGIKVFMFCRKNRLHPCLMLMKDPQGKPVRLKNGTLWSHKALAASAQGHPSHKSNGNTPAGIMTIDSVMPKADQQLVYGKFRRIVLNFVPKTKKEYSLRSLLPKSSHDSEWWRPSTVARDIGRAMIRIHGTGRINKDPNSSFYPHTRTNGCISQKENTYDGITYKDQRILLDTIMKTMNLKTIEDNETKVKGVLYLMDLDETEAPVLLSDLSARGIE